MSTINNVNFDQVVQQAVSAGVSTLATNASGLRDIIENIADGIVNDVAFLAKKKKSGELDEADARRFMEDQKTVARMRLLSIAIVSAKIAERVWNAIANVFRTAIKSALGGWVVV